MPRLRKGKGSSRTKPYYERQRLVTARHKTLRASKRARKLAKWVALGVKKNGQKVLPMAERKERAAARKVTRDTRRRIARAESRANWIKWQQLREAKEKTNGKSNRRGNRGKPRKMPKEYVEDES